MLFLGSGISYASEMPTVKQITDDLLQNEWSRYTGGTYFKGRDPSEYLEEVYLALAEQQVLKILAERITEYLSKRGVERRANYEDLYYVLRQLKEEETRDSANPVAGPFCENVFPLFNKPLEELSERHAFKYHLSELFSMCQELIADVVAANLRKIPETVVGLDFLRQVVTDPSVSRLTIVTLNHDALVESCLEKADIRYIDGFRKDADGHLTFDREALKSDDHVKLLKLHGSVDWYRVGSRLVKRPSGNLICAPRPVILCGTDNKPISYSFGIFQDLHYYWQRMLDDHKLMVMSGYGWNDIGISGKILQWLEGTDTRLVLLDKDVDSLLKRSNSRLPLQYRDLIVSDKIIPLHRWLEDTNWGSVKARIGLWDKAEELPILDGILLKTCAELEDKWVLLDRSERDTVVRNMINEIFLRCLFVDDAGKSPDEAGVLDLHMYLNKNAHDAKEELFHELAASTGKVLACGQRKVNSQAVLIPLKMAISETLSRIQEGNCAARELKRILRS